MKSVKNTVMISASFSALLIGAMATTQCYAQAADGSDTKATAPGLETIIVTAMRDKTDASKTPISLTAISGDNLADQGITAVSGLGEYVPNLTIDQSVTSMRITIRGVVSQDTSEKGDPSAAFMVNNIYYAKSEEQNISFYDVARVEVLRGPQGTLYGRNTTAGVINVITNDPTDTQSGAMDLTLGNFNARVLNGYYNTPVTDWLDLRAAFSYNHHDSYLINSQNNDVNPGNDRDDFSARLSAKIKLGDKATLVLRGDDSQVHTVAAAYVPETNFYANGVSGWKNAGSDAARTTIGLPYFAGNTPYAAGLGATTLTGPQTTSTQVLENPRTQRSAWGINADFNWDMGPVTMTYEGSHRYFNQNDLYNYGGDFSSQVAPLVAAGYLPSNMIGYQSWGQTNTTEDSHELRFSLNDAGPLKAQAGLYYFKEGLNSVSNSYGLWPVFRTGFYVGGNASVQKALSGADGLVVSVPISATAPYGKLPTTALGQADYAAGMAQLYAAQAYGNNLYDSITEPMMKSISRGAFGQVTYAIVPSLRLTAGVRYSEDHKARASFGAWSVAPTYNAATDLQFSLNLADYHSSKLTWRTGLEYDVSDNTMWYGTISTGYKSGGFNDGCLAGAQGFGLTCGTGLFTAKPASQLFYKPENLTAYETGVKSKFFDNRVQVNATVFYYDYKNMQLSGAATDSQNNITLVTTNATTASVYGFELEGQALLSDVDHITYAASLLDAQYGDYTAYLPQAVGNPISQSWNHLPLDNSPKWTYSLGYDRTFRAGNGDLVFSLFTRWTGKYNISVASLATRWTVPSYHKSDVTLRYQPDHSQWNISLYAKNLEDKVVPVWIGYGEAIPSDPRTFGVRFGVNF